MRIARELWSGPRPWLRGPASFDGDWLVLDKQQAVEYHPYEEKGIAFALANVRTPRDAVEFIGKYGMLKHGPEDEDCREAFLEWQQEANCIQNVFFLVRALREGVRGNMELAERVKPNIQYLFSAPPANERETLEQIAKTIALIINQGLNGVGQGIAAHQVDFEVGQLGGFAFIARPHNLLGYIYHELAMLIVNQVPVNTCEGCGRVFLVKDVRQKYCSPQCSNRARFNRWYKKNKKPNEG